MKYVYNWFSKNLVSIICGSGMVFLAFLGAQTMPAQQSYAYKESVITMPSTTLFENTTSSTIETTTTQLKSTIKTIKPYVSTTILDKTPSGSNGPPHNITTLIGCISFYESTWGKDPNVFQFTKGTWEAYGGKGSPSNATYARQEEVFWLAWNDDGEHHWAAQKGRCF